MINIPEQDAPIPYVPWIGYCMANRAPVPMCFPDYSDSLEPQEIAEALLAEYLGLD